MVDLSKLKEGDVLSEHQYYIVKGKEMDRFRLETANGGELYMSADLVKNYTTSASLYEKHEELARTKIVDTILSNANLAMTICFTKKVKEKEVADALLAMASSTNPLTAKEAKAKAKELLSGEVREMVGYHTGSKDPDGRIVFYDRLIEDPKARRRLVDPRTIQWAIIDNVKYTVK